LAQCYLKEHKPEAAEGEYRQALSLDEKLIRAHYGLGQALLALGRTEEARREFHLHSELLARRRNSQSGISASHD
jgi:tetratricopeptide (TPR) repeat protein